MIRRLMFRSTRKIKMYKTDRAALCRIANAITVVAGVSSAFPLPIEDI